jgi:endonuclease/exonuclease/phosphatase family metal-dependent hydrolase
MHSSYLRVTGNLVWLSLVFSSLSVGQSNLRESVLGVLTWNTFNLPTIAGEMGQINLDEEERGKQVAKLLKESSYDVIALNEVFDETVRAALLKEAKVGSRAFRFIVEKLDGGGLEDSGLMLLSRLEPIRFRAQAPVIPIPFDSMVAGRRCSQQPVWWSTGPNSGSTPSWRDDNGGECLVAFHDYIACTYDAAFGAECQSSKGVGYVRLRQRNGLPLDVFWSHMQADAGNFEKARREQFAELAKMIEFWSAKGERDTVLMGDLNVNGVDIQGAEYLRTIAFGNGSTLGALGFRDLWPWLFGAPKADSGPTYTSRNDHVADGQKAQRLDYVLWRDQKGRNARAQHPKVERNFDVIRPGGSTIDLSDHFGVGVEIRQAVQAPFHNPEPAAPTNAVKLSSLPGGVFGERIDTMGGCQWLALDPGTYTVTSLETEPLRISAWYEDDISEEINFFRGDSELHSKRKKDEAQIASDRAFLLKVCWAQYTRKAVFKIVVGPNTGADPLHPVVLFLNRYSKGVYGNQYGANPTNLFWAVVQVPPTFSGQPHAMRVELQPTISTNVRFGRAAVGSANPSVTWVTGMMPASSGINEVAGDWGGPASLELHVVMERQPPANPSQGFSFQIRAVTDHQEVELGVLECKEQEDATYDDHVRITYSADGVIKKIIDLGDFDEGQDTNLSQRGDIGRKWVRGNVRITIFEQDGGDLDDDVLSGDALDNLGTDVIDPMTGAVPKDAETKRGKLRFTQDGANYELRWKRRR